MSATAVLVIDKAITLEMLPETRTGRHAMFLPTVHSERHCGVANANSMRDRGIDLKVFPWHTGVAEQALPSGLGRAAKSRVP